MGIASGYDPETEPHQRAAADALDAHDERAGRVALHLWPEAERRAERARLVESLARAREMDRASTRSDTAP